MQVKDCYLQECYSALLQNIYCRKCQQQPKKLYSKTNAAEKQVYDAIFFNFLLNIKATAQPAADIKPSKE